MNNILNKQRSQPIDTVIKTFFYLDRKEYEVTHFQIVFGQPIDHKGQPQHEVGGGQFVISLSQLADDNIYNWGKKSEDRRNCSVCFKTENQGTVLEFNFHDAYCISLLSKINAFSGTETLIVITPNKLTMNGIDHDNEWRLE